MLEREDRELIESRKRGLRHLDVAVWLFPLLWLGTVAWTWFRFPLLNNPWALHESLSRKGALSRQALESLAAMAPIVTLLLQVLVLAFLWMGLRLLRRERRLITLLERAYGSVDSPPPSPLQSPL